MIEASVQASGIKTIVRTSIIEKSRTKVEQRDGGAWGVRELMTLGLCKQSTCNQDVGPSRVLSLTLFIGSSQKRGKRVRGREKKQNWGS